ncbi:uncharacterized protein LOC112564098 [Pomacea canaliculata]|uniref:uncharacterized protein LOC112564098 n=1 Tax=Pomacea canaliculata TaxID=400727 RepID=UPI000D738C0D|nr:uncharacterized protein LOC112564098 [Pomacea canaliculata]
MKARYGHGAQKDGKGGPQLEGPSHGYSDSCRQKPLTVATVVKAVSVLGEPHGSTFASIRKLLQREWDPSLTSREIKQTLVRGVSSGKVKAVAHHFFSKATVGSDHRRYSRQVSGSRRPSRCCGRRSRRRRRRRKRRRRRRRRRRRPKDAKRFNQNW